MGSYTDKVFTSGESITCHEDHNPLQKARPSEPRFHLRRCYYGGEEQEQEQPNVSLINFERDLQVPAASPHFFDGAQLSAGFYDKTNFSQGSTAGLFRRSSSVFFGE